MAHSKSEIRKAKNLLNKYAPKGEQLAYINPKEANLLKRKGGSGKMTKAGIRSYTEDEEDTGDVSNAGSSSSNNNNNSDDNSPQAQPRSILSRIGGFIKGAAATALTAATFGVGTLAAIGINKTAQYVTKNIGGRMTRTQVNTNQARLSGSQTFDYQKKSNPNINMGGGDGGDNNPAQNVGGRIVKLSPTSAEVSQSKATDVTYDSRKTKARGRSMTIRTNSRGVGNNMASVLGKKSLLGAA